MINRQCRHIKKSGQRCGNSAMSGSDVCHVQAHAGPAMNAQKTAVDNLARGEAAEYMQREERRPDLNNPLEAMVSLAHEVFELKEQLNEIAGEPGDWWTQNGDGDQVQLETARTYERALDRATKLVSDMSRLKLDERMVNVSERQGRIIGEVLLRVLYRLEIPEEERSRARTLLTEELQELGQ